MKNSFLLILALFLSLEATANDGLDHQTIQQKYKLPAGWVPNPRIAFNNSEPPLIFVEQGDTTTVTFPKEVAACRESSSIFQVAERKENTELYEVDIITDKSAVEELRESMGRRGLTVYDSPFVNLNCRFKNGKMAILRLKLYPYPYYSVEMIVPRQRRDYRDFARLEHGKTSEGVIRQTPFQEPPPSDERPTYASKTRDRDYGIFASILGEEE